MRRYLSLILALAIKDGRIFLADRRAAALSFLVPVVLASAFGLVFHKTPGESAAPRLPMVVVIESDGPFTRKVVADLLASPRVEAEIVTRAEADARAHEEYAQFEVRRREQAEVQGEEDALRSLEAAARELPPRSREAQP